jgi:signal transduction histidine kinase
MSLKRKTEEILRTQEQLIVQEKLASLGRLTAGIAHEIQNPLNFVINFTELSKELLDELGRLCEDPGRREQALAELHETIEKVYQHSRRAEGIVNSMMMHSRTSSDDRVQTDVNNLVRQAVTLAEHSARSSRAVCNPSISFTFDPALGPMNIVPIELSRVILNLVENAMDAVCSRQHALWPASFDAEIHIETVQRPGSVDIRIRDNGTGIPEAVLERIFDPFFTTKPPGKGTGLGLSIIYDIIHQKYNGTIEVSTEENEFTEFHISIPSE